MSQGAGRKSQVCAKSAWVQSEYALARWIGVAFVSACMALSAAGAPRESGGGAFTLVVENDLFSANGQDRNYTSGLKAAYLTPAGAEPRWARRLGDILPGYADRLDTRFEFEIGQSMYTPRDLTRTNPDPTDRAYAGLLYASLGLISWTDTNILDQAQIVLGVVGPASQAGASQRWLHRRLDGSVEPRGWGTQIPNQFAGELRLQRTHRIPIWGASDGPQVDIASHYGVSIGNLTTAADLGAGFRAGWNVPVDFGPPRVSPSLPGSGYFVTNHDFGWYVFGGVDARYVAHSLVLDERGSAGARVDRKPWVADGQLGIATYWGNLRLAYTQVWRSREFETQKSDYAQFGAISMSWRR